MNSSNQSQELATQPAENLAAAETAVGVAGLLPSIERLARDLVWAPDSWDAYLIAKENGDGPAEDPEFWLLAQAVEAKFGPQPPCEEDLAYADKVIANVSKSASDAEVDAILRNADIEPDALVNEFINRIGKELRAAVSERDALREALANLAFSYDDRDRGDGCWCSFEDNETCFERTGAHEATCQHARAAIALATKSVTGEQGG